MTALQLPVIIAGGGIALLAWQSQHANDPHAPASPVAQSQPIKGVNNASPFGVLSSSSATTKIGSKTNATKGVNIKGGTNYTPSALISGGAAAASVVQQKLRELEAEAKRQYDNMTDVAKNSAAQTANGYLKPSPNLTGHETFEEAGKKIGASIGAAAGSAACAAIPIPGVNAILAATACATLGAIIGAYLGDKLGGWAKSLYNDVKAWADKQWDKVQDKVSGAAEDAYNAVSGAAHDAYSTVSGWF